MYEYGYENLNPNYFNELSKEGFQCFNYYQGMPHDDFWYGSNVFGQFSPRYLIDFLTAQISEELGFRKWFVDMNFRSTSAYNYLKSRMKVVAETLYIDFDTTQMELDYISGSNNLETKYGSVYTSASWKSKKNHNNSGRYYSDNTDWSNYDDNLDMDQQSPDFWNQF
jgi:hypothetical protein